MLPLLLYALIAGLFSLVGGFLLLWQPKFSQNMMTPLISFGAGAFLAAAFLDILPEALETTIEPHPVLLATLGGFLFFFALERFMMRFLHHTPGHQHSDHTESLSFLLILGDSIHNFMDGLIIALAYVANPILGLPTALAIAAHEIPQEIGDFSILMHLKWKAKDIIIVNVLQSLLTVPGIFMGYWLGQLVAPQLPLLLGATAGIFLYIAGSDLIPEIHHRSGHTQFLPVLLPMLVSILSVYLLAGLTHGH